MRLRYGGSASMWGFAVYLASKDGYQDSVLPQRLHRRGSRKSPRHRLRPLPRRPHRLDLNHRRIYGRDHLLSVRLDGADGIGPGDDEPTGASLVVVTVIVTTNDGAPRSGRGRRVGLSSR